MPTVTTSHGTPFEAAGNVLGSRAVQMEAKGTVAKPIASFQEVVVNFGRLFFMNQESVVAVSSASFNQVTEQLKTVRAVF